VQNLLNSIDESESKVHYIIYTTSTTIKELTPIRVKSSNVKIIRLGFSGNDLNILTRYTSYFIFNIGTFCSLLYNLPRKVMYYETLSFLPVYLYKLFNKNAGTWAHYHEYTTPQEYRGGMSLTKAFHSLERKYYGKIDVLSHTNADRMNLFLKDISPLSPKKTFILPNYPPKWWSGFERTSSATIRFIYIGSLSMTTMFTREFSAWVTAQAGKVTWDIYSYNITDDAKAFLDGLPFISLKKGVNYSELPGVLVNYDIGVILYKGHISNYIYNAPNKLFEYLKMGLQVWLPQSLLGAIEYLESTNHPIVMALNFKKLTLSSGDIVLGKNVPGVINSAEDTYAPLIHYLEKE
jgi:hypothetical protein